MIKQPSQEKDKKDKKRTKRDYYLIAGLVGDAAKMVERKK